VQTDDVVDETDDVIQDETCRVTVIVSGHNIRWNIYINSPTQKSPDSKESEIIFVPLFWTTFFGPWSQQCFTSTISIIETQLIT